METDKRYECLSADSAETIITLLNIPGLQEKWNELKITEKEGEGYDMCQAILEMQEECIEQGIEQGKTQGALEKTNIFVRNMLKQRIFISIFGSDVSPIQLFFPML